MPELKSKPIPKSSLAEKELDKAEQQFKDFDNQIKEMTLDRMNEAPKKESAPQINLSQRDIERSKDIYLKPKKSISVRDKFNENFRKDYEFDKEFVQFQAENKEIIGDTIEMWTRPYAGMPAEFWEVPVNRPVWGPRYLAEQIKRCSYHRLVMSENKITSSDGMGSYYGQMAADTTVQRLDCHPISQRKSVFMGASGF